jgi:hypothetical protein
VSLIRLADPWAAVGQSIVGGLPDWAPLLIAPVGALGFLVYWYLFLRDD